MRVTLNSLCEKNLILKSFVENTRIDGRKVDDYRPVKITMGQEHGTCFVELGHTKVFSCISSELVAPKQHRPQSGILQINLDLSPMACPNFESGRLGERGIEIIRLLERTLKETSCIDLESLCIIAGEKVWQIRADVHVIDNDGSIVDCASIAVICALKSFRRPDVTICGEHFIVHETHDHDPVPLNLFHMPFCLTFGLTENGNCITVDPCEREQFALDGEIVIAMNSHKEICTIHCTGSSLIKKIQVLRCVSMAAQRSAFIAQMVKDTFELDALERSKKCKKGYWTLIRPYSILYASCSKSNVVHSLKPTDNLQSQGTLENFESAAEEINLGQRKSKKKGKVTKLGTASPSLMFQWNQNDDDDVDTAIVDEILNVRISDGRSGSKANGDDDDEITITAVKKSTSKLRREKLKKKDKDVQQLLIDLEEDDSIADNNRSNKR